MTVDGPPRPSSAQLEIRSEPENQPDGLVQPLTKRTDMEGPLQAKSGNYMRQKSFCQDSSMGSSIPSRSKLVGATALPVVAAADLECQSTASTEMVGGVSSGGDNQLISDRRKDAHCGVTSGDLDGIRHDNDADVGLEHGVANVGSEHGNLLAAEIPNRPQRAIQSIGDTGKSSDGNAGHESGYLYGSRIDRMLTAIYRSNF